MTQCSFAYCCSTTFIQHRLSGKQPGSCVSVLGCRAGSMWRQQHRKVVPGHFLLRGGGRHMSQQRAVARSKSLYRERGRARGLGDHTPLLFSISPVLISLTATTHLPQYITSLCPQPLWAKRHPLFLLDRWLHSKSITHLSHSNNLQLTNTLLFVRRPCKFWKSEYWFQWL